MAATTVIDRLPRIILMVVLGLAAALVALGRAPSGKSNGVPLAASAQSGSQPTAGYVTNIEKATQANDDFRHVLFTGAHLQLVLMTLKGGEDIGVETHAAVDQFIRIESGQGRAVLAGKEYDLENGSAVVIPAGVEHNIMNRSPTDPLKLYTLYAPPNHPDGTINRTKADAIEYEATRHRD